MNRKIYICGRYDRREELSQFAADLEYSGYLVTSRWILGEHDMDNVNDETKARFALEDLEDLYSAGTVIAFTELPSVGYNRGGRHTEFGAAIGWNKELVLVGPRENVFYYLPNVKYFSHLDSLYTFYNIWSPGT